MASCNKGMLLICSILLIVCGLACAASCWFANDLFLRLADEQCKLAIASNSLCADTSLEACKTQMLAESGCECSADGTTCDCSNSLYGLAYRWWYWAMWGAGAFGLVACFLCTGVPALVATQKRVRGCNVVLFSSCAGLLCIPQMAIGAFFVTVAYMTQNEGYMSTFFATCGSGFPTLSQFASGVGPDQASQAALNAANEAETCGGRVLCMAMSGLGQELFSVSLAIGISFFLGGFLQLFGTCTCCCCYRGLPGFENNKVALDPVLPLTNSQRTQSVRSLPRSQSEHQIAISDTPKGKSTRTLGYSASHKNLSRINPA
mmetsp:Transcript_19752/g.48482  ORF Transcript_19752/g.48482 Transcript_19752/m.48482 type:complete len:318 (+) Transcript_19752:46-999(+)